MLLQQLQQQYSADNAAVTASAAAIWCTRQKAKTGSNYVWWGPGQLKTLRKARAGNQQDLIFGSAVVWFQFCQLFQREGKTCSYHAHLACGQRLWKERQRVVFIESYYISKRITQVGMHEHFSIHGQNLLRRYSQTKSPGWSIPDFIKDDCFVLTSCQSGSYYLDEEICSLIGLHFFLSLDRASF
jgi:hypothetical protein